MITNTYFQKYCIEDGIINDIDDSNNENHAKLDLE